MLVLCSPDDITLYDIVHDCEQFKKLVNVDTVEVSQFLNLCNKTTQNTNKVTELEFPDSFDRVSFTSNTSQLRPDQIIANLKEEVQKPVGFKRLIIFMENRLCRKKNSEDSSTSLVSKGFSKPMLSKITCKVHVLEIEWLEKNSATFLDVVIKEESSFDSELVQNLLREFDMWYPTCTFIFLPFILYFGLVTYYFCFIITDAYEPRTGFVQGS